MCTGTCETAFYYASGCYHGTATDHLDSRRAASHYQSSSMLTQKVYRYFVGSPTEWKNAFPYQRVFSSLSLAVKKNMPLFPVPLSDVNSSNALVTPQSTRTKQDIQQQEIHGPACSPLPGLPLFRGIPQEYRARYTIPFPLERLGRLSGPNISLTRVIPIHGIIFATPSAMEMVGAAQEEKSGA
jgi:hypothetical protein